MFWLANPTLTANNTYGNTFRVANAPAWVVNQWHCAQLTVETMETRFVGTSAATLEIARICW